MGVISKLKTLCLGAFAATAAVPAAHAETSINQSYVSDELMDRLAGRYGKSQAHAPVNDVTDPSVRRVTTFKFAPITEHLKPGEFFEDNKITILTTGTERQLGPNSAWSLGQQIGIISYTNSHKEESRGLTYGLYLKRDFNNFFATAGAELAVVNGYEGFLKTWNDALPIPTISAGIGTQLSDNVSMQIGVRHVPETLVVPYLGLNFTPGQ